MEHLCEHLDNINTESGTKGTQHIDQIDEATVSSTSTNVSATEDNYAESTVSRKISIFFLYRIINGLLYKSETKLIISEELISHYCTLVPFINYLNDDLTCFFCLIHIMNRLVLLSLSF